jgi:glyoxylase-like metal-dependent hydrolase (beta-lactamase superfamily II)
VLLAAVSASALAQSSASISVQPVRDNIEMLTVDGVNIAVQSGPQGLVVVDAGPASASSEVIAELQKIGGKIRYVIETGNEDELIGGAPAVAAKGESMMQSGLGRPNGSVVNADVGKVALIVARQAVADELATRAGYPEYGIPTETFTRPQYNFFLNGEGVSSIWMPAANSSVGTVVVFHGSDVVVAGDVLDMTRFPKIDVAHGGSVQGEINALDRLINEYVIAPVPAVTDTEGTRVIPVRGPVCTQSDLVIYRDMVAVVRDRIADLIQQGKGLTQVQAANPTAGYNTRFGADSGEWTTKDFVAAVYNSLVAEKKKHGRSQG